MTWLKIFLPFLSVNAGLGRLRKLEALSNEVLDNFFSDLEKFNHNSYKRRYAQVVKRFDRAFNTCGGGESGSGDGEVEARSDFFIRISKTNGCRAVNQLTKGYFRWIDNNFDNLLECQRGKFGPLVAKLPRMELRLRTELQCNKKGSDNSEETEETDEAENAESSEEGGDATENEAPEDETEQSENSDILDEDPENSNDSEPNDGDADAEQEKSFSCNLNISKEISVVKALPGFDQSDFEIQWFEHMKWQDEDSDPDFWYDIYSLSGELVMDENSPDAKPIPFETVWKRYKLICADEDLDTDGNVKTV